MHASRSNLKAPGSPLDLVLLYPGAVEGGADQIIVDLLPQLVSRPGVAAWAFERTIEPVPVVALLLDVEGEALPDIVDECEELLSSQLQDDPGLAMQPLVEMPGRGRRQADMPWGVRHSRVESTAGAEGMRARMHLEQTISTVATKVLDNVRSRHWDRKSIAPTLLAELLARVCRREDLAGAAYSIMQHLLAAEPSAEPLTRQFRINAHKLAKERVPILLEGDVKADFDLEVGPSLQVLAAKLGEQTDATQQAVVWQRLAAAVGFTAVEAAYLACLASSAEQMQA